MPMPRLTGEHARYLRLLGVAPAAPGLALLRTLVSAHLYRVRFENVSKLLLFDREGAGRPISLSEFLDGIEHHDFGGTCYTSNPFLCELLAAIGFDAKLHAADMATPNVHTSIRVHVEGAAYHVDVGYGAPFAAPMRLDDLPHTTDNGRDRYVLTASEEPERFTMSYFVDGEPRHRYTVHPPPVTAAFFTPIIVSSFERDRTFMQWLRISRQFADGSADLRDRQLVVHRAGARTERTIAGVAELRRVVDDVFGMPRCRVERAVAVLEGLTGRPFFD